MKKVESKRDGGEQKTDLMLYFVCYVDKQPVEWRARLRRALEAVPSVDQQLALALKVAAYSDGGGKVLYRQADRHSKNRIVIPGFVCLGLF